MPRFIYTASAVAFGGRLRRPFERYVEPQAACVLSSTGGKACSRSDGYTLADPSTGQTILSFASAETVIEGGESSPGVHNTIVRSTLRDLNVLGVLRADEIVSVMSLSYDTRTDRVTIDTAGSAFVNLRINGRAFDVQLDHGLGREASDYEAFRRNHPEYPEKRGAIRSALGRNDSLVFEPYEHGYFHQPGFGRIHFAEWSAAPYRQTLTMLRLRLGSPAEGELMAADGYGDGEPYP